jgi:flagellin
MRNMQNAHTNLKAAESVIRDVDYAAESADFNKSNIIAQAGTYAMSQANQMTQGVMTLLR